MYMVLGWAAHYETMPRNDHSQISFPASLPACLPASLDMWAADCSPHLTSLTLSLVRLIIILVRVLGTRNY